MRALILIGTILLVLALVTSLPRPKNAFVLRSVKALPFATREKFTAESRYVKRRSAPATKGGKPGAKGYAPQMPHLRKGEYVCGNKICMLKAGEIPNGCNGLCQHAV